jgi:gliding motility-associated protein GldC
MSRSANRTADIHISVTRSGDGDIGRIRWSATDAPVTGPQDAKAMFLALWDADARTSLRIDLWTYDMTVDDMNDFVFQTLLTLGDTYRNATSNLELMADIKSFARTFAEKAAKAAARGQGRADR